MGKGLNGFMSKKAFHPGSYANQKRIQEAEAKAEAKRKHDEETLAQYQKEQELFHQKSLVSRESKEKLSLNFMYEAPPGAEKSDEKKSDKIEWKGSSSGKVTICKSGMTTQITHPGGIGKDEHNICLEWKREKLVKNSAQEVKSRSISSLERNTGGVKLEKLKEEPQTDLKLDSQKNIDAPKAETSRHKLAEEFTFSKRIKKER